MIYEKKCYSNSIMVYPVKSDLIEVEMISSFNGMSEHVKNVMTLDEAKMLADSILDHINSRIR